MELGKHGNVENVNPKIAGDVLAKRLGYRNMSELRAAYTTKAMPRGTQIIHCGTKLPEAPVKEQFSFLQFCKDLVKPAVERLTERMNKIAGKFMPNGIGVKSPIER